MKALRTPREKILLMGLTFMVLGMFFFRWPLQRELLAVCVLSAEAPSPAVVKELVESYQERSNPLKRLWHSEKLPHRLAALNYLEAEARMERGLLTSLEAELSAAATDADLEARDLAFTLLARAKNPDLPRLSFLQTRDADPAARVLGLQYLRQSGDARFLPEIMPCLDDADPSVVSMAGSLIQRWSGQDFGIRVSQALPQFTRQEAVEPTSANLALLVQGVNRAKEWWKYNQASDAPPNASSYNNTPSRRLRAPEFSVEDMDGRSVRLSDFRGQAVALAFWDTATPVSLRYLKNLQKSQLAITAPLVALGISLDTTALERSHEHKHEHSQHHGTGDSAKRNIPEVHHKLHEVMASEALTLRILVDTTGQPARLFNINQLPTTILIDRDGYLRRRFVGPRTAEALAVMFGETISSTEHSVAKTISARETKNTGEPDKEVEKLVNR